MKYFSVKVLQKHLDEGKRCDCFNCPISLAIKDKFPNMRVVTQRSHIKIGINEENYDIYDHNAYDYISCIDMGQPVSPQIIELTLRYSNEEIKKDEVLLHM